MIEPLVSILCLCYNQEEFIIESLNSIKAQTFTNYEIIICDDASKDNSAKIVEKWINKNPDLSVKFIKHEENKGICKSLNEIFKLSSGKYIQVLALDDILLPEKLERHVAIMEKSSIKEALVFSDALMIDNNSLLLDNRFIAFHIKYLKLTSGNYYERLIKDNFIPAMSVLLKSNIIRDVGGWDEDLSYEDYDMWLRLSKEFDFIYDHEPSCKYRIHDNNTHKKNNFLHESYFSIMYKHKENLSVKNILFKIIELEYLNKKTTSKKDLFYKFYKSNSFSDKLIKLNKGLFIYKLIKYYKLIIN